MELPLSATDEYIYFLFTSPQTYGKLIGII